MKKFVFPALGAAFVLGVAPAAAEEVLLSQLMIIGQPGQTGSANRTLPSGSQGIAPFNFSAPGPAAAPPAPNATQPTSFVRERGDLNVAEPEVAGPAERDEGGRLRPSVDRTQARFTGERGADGKLLPTFVPQQAQARPAPQQTTPPAPPPEQLKREQPPAAKPGMTKQRQPSGQAQTGTMGTGKADKSMQKGQTRTLSGREAEKTAALNALSAEGFTNVGMIERVGNNLQTTAMKQGKQVTVQVDPQTFRVMER